jgi:hypothetical protein
LESHIRDQPLRVQERKYRPIRQLAATGAAVGDAESRRSEAVTQRSFLGLRSGLISGAGQPLRKDMLPSGGGIEIVIECVSRRVGRSKRLDSVQDHVPGEIIRWSQSLEQMDRDKGSTFP